MRVDLVELSRRMLANYDPTAQSTCDGELLDLTTREAYALQVEIARLREQRGERVIGYNVGCTSQTIQHQLGVNPRRSLRVVIQAPVRIAMIDSDRFKLLFARARCCRPP